MCQRFVMEAEGVHLSQWFPSAGENLSDCVCLGLLPPLLLLPCLPACPLTLVPLSPSLGLCQLALAQSDWA